MIRCFLCHHHLKYVNFLIKSAAEHSKEDSRKPEPMPLLCQWPNPTNPIGQARCRRADLADLFRYSLMISSENEHILDMVLRLGVKR
jgi:hypothetical protein